MMRNEEEGEEWDDEVGIGFKLNEDVDVPKVSSR